MQSLKLLSVLMLMTCGLATSTFAQTEESQDSTIAPFPGTMTPTRTYTFEKSAGKAKVEKAAKEALGTLKFHEEKNSVRLEFEGRGLEKGKYQIVKTESCEKLRRRLLSNKPVHGETELFAFDTEYGHISTEKNLTEKKLEDLGLETTALALIKVEKRSSRYISCAQ